MSFCYFDWGFLLLTAAWLLSLFSHIMGALLHLGYMPFPSMLNCIVARLCSPWLIGIDLICNKDIYDSISFTAFFIVLFMNLMYASACPLCWWLYDDVY